VPCSARHFVLSSGLHSDRYVQCALLLEVARQGGAGGRMLDATFEETLGPSSVEVVVSPALGASSSATRWRGPWSQVRLQPSAPTGG